MNNNMRLINANELHDIISDVTSSAHHDVMSVANVHKCIENTRTIDAVEVRHGRWVLEESPYAEYEEAMDGESHPRYVCNLCRFEAGFDRDPDGFANYQDRSDWCGGCGAKMDLKEDEV